MRNTLPGNSQDACLKEVRLEMELPCSLRVGDAEGTSQSGCSSRAMLLFNLRVVGVLNIAPVVGGIYMETQHSASHEGKAGVTTEGLSMARE